MAVLDVPPESMELAPMVWMVPKLVWLARVAPDQEPVSTSGLNILFRLIGFVTNAGFCAIVVAPLDAGVISGEPMISEPGLRLRLDVIIDALELLDVAPVRMIVPPELLLTEFSLVEGLVPVVPLSVLLVCATAGSTKNPATRAAKRCRWRKDCISDFLPIAGLASNLFSRAFQPKSMRQMCMSASLVR
jgi:hypothetical protein